MKEESENNDEQFTSETTNMEEGGVMSANILIGCTGSVAALKLPLLVQALKEQYLEKFSVTIKIIATKSSQHFFIKEELPSYAEFITDENEWSSWKQRGDPVLHIELAKWADVLAIAPLDANTLAKMSNGICDNLLTCVTRAWIMTKPLLFCPAMNTRMWEHPLTSVQIEALKNWGHTEVPCVAKTLMCGDTGMGAMADVHTIVQYIYEALCKQKIK